MSKILYFDSSFLHGYCEDIRGKEGHGVPNSLLAGDVDLWGKCKKQKIETRSKENQLQQKAWSKKQGRRKGPQYHQRRSSLPKDQREAEEIDKRQEGSSRESK